MGRPWGGMFEPVLLMLEAQQVMALRLAKLSAGGPAALGEASRMITEKVSATASAAGLMTAAIASGAPDAGTGDVVRMLRRRVRANRRRLRRPSV